MTNTAPKHQPATPLQFLAANPKYIYRDHKGRATAQWRQAALDMANDRAKLIEALRNVLAKDGNGLRTTGELPARALLRELGEAE